MARRTCQRHVADLLTARARDACLITKVPGLVPILPIYSRAGNREKFRFLLQSIRIAGAGRCNGVGLPPLSARTALIKRGILMSADLSAG